MKNADPPKILIVDDTTANLQLLANLLKEHGYTVYPASDGALALEFLRSTLPDLILLDVRMPGMDGFEVCRKIKADERTRNIPIIFISILEDSHDKVKGFQEGAVDYITKPFHSEEVLSRVGTHLRLRELAERLEQKVNERTNELMVANKLLQQEIVERKRTEESLRNSERRFFDIIDFLPDATFAIDLEGRITIWNRTAEELSGYKAEDMLGKGNYEYAIPFYGIRRPLLIDLVLKPDRQIENLYPDLRRERDLVIGESYALTPKHGKGYLLGIAAPLYDSKGNVIGAIESVRDITQRKEAEEEIRAANERFRSVLRASTSYAIISTDPEGIITVFNEGAELMLGYKADEVVDKMTVGFMHDPEEIAARAAEIGIEPGFEVFVRAARGGETETREWTYIRKGGSRITVSLTITAMRSEDGELKGFIGIARDVTNEKKLEQQLLQAQKMESVGLLAGGMAHDFNNLLTPIIGYSEMLHATFESGDPRCSQLLQISCAAERAKDLIQRLLAFSRKQMIELKTIDPGELISRFEDMLRRTILENVQIEIKIAPDLGLVRADAGQIEQILINLAVNAQDAMPAGGILTIEATNVDLDKAYTSRHADVLPGPYVMIAVSDTGTGMDEKTMERIFEPFFTTKEMGKGTGLGLATVYGIVKQHGGSISVYSEKNHGSTFKVFLPRLMSEKAAGEKKVAIQHPVAHGTETILVVEDDDTVREFVCNMLESLRYNVLTAEDIDHCIDLAEKFEGTIDLLLTDVVMPRMNGKQLYELLRHTRSEMKVLFMSGYTINIIGHHCVLDEGVPFIAKPFTIHGLAEKIRNVLDTR